MIEWISKSILTVPKKSGKEIIALFNARFNTGFTPLQIKRLCNRSGIKAAEGDEKGVYNVYKGHKVGTEAVFSKRDRIVFVKISDVEISDKPIGCVTNSAGTWREKHFVIWEAVNGPIPEEHIVIFADRNKANFDIGNLLLVSKREFGCMAGNGLLSDIAEKTRVGLAIAKQMLAISDAIKRLTGNKTANTTKTKYRRLIMNNSGAKSDADTMKNTDDNFSCQAMTETEAGVMASERLIGNNQGGRGDDRKTRRSNQI
jgi:hypothetical protein